MNRGGHHIQMHWDRIEGMMYRHIGIELRGWYTDTLG